MTAAGGHQTAKLSDVLKLAKLYKVFPCRPDKKPYTGHGFKDASQDPGQIRAWWHQHPDALVGVPTGGEHGLVVIDLDTDKHTDETREWLTGHSRLLKSARTHITRSGGTHHLFTSNGTQYKSGADCRLGGTKRPGIDVRADGGYIIWWPAHGLPVRNATKLPELPSGVLDTSPRLANGVPPPLRSAPKDALLNSPSKWLRNLPQLTAALRCIDPTSRDDWRDIGMILSLESGGRPYAFELWDEWSSGALHNSAVESYTGTEDCRTQWDSYRHDTKKPLRLGSLFHRAKEDGYVPPAPARVPPPTPATAPATDPAPAQVPPEIAELNERYAAIVCGKASIFADESTHKGHRYSLITVQDMDFRFRTVRIDTGLSTQTGRPIIKKLSDYWLDSPYRREVHGIVFDPGSPWGFMPDGRTANIYSGFAYTPHKPDSKHSCEMYKELTFEVLAGGNREYYDYLIGWLAHGVQKLDTLPGVAIVLKGGEGVGKSGWAQAYLNLFGAGGMPITDPRHLVGNFTGHLSNKIALFADEALFAGDSRVADALKGLITQKDKTVEAKFETPITVRNYTRLIIASNHARVVQASDDARRFAIFKLEKHPSWDKPRFRKLFAQMDNGGHEALLYELLHHDISDFDVSKFPHTHELGVEKALNDDPYKQWIYGMLLTGSNSPLPVSGTGSLWHHSVSYAELLTLFRDSVQNNNMAMRGVHKRLGPALRDYCPSVASRTNENARGYIFPSLQRCRADYDLKVGYATNWDDPDVAAQSPPTHSIKKPRTHKPRRPQ